jgi:hypothetical protein
MAERLPVSFCPSQAAFYISTNGDQLCTDEIQDWTDQR